MLLSKGARPSRFVNRALLALRTRIARLSRFMAHDDFFSAGVSVGPVAAVPFWRLFLGLFCIRRNTRRGLRVVSAAVVGEADDSCADGAMDSLPPNTAFVFSVLAQKASCQGATIDVF